MGVCDRAKRLWQPVAVAMCGIGISVLPLLTVLGCSKHAAKAEAPRASVKRIPLKPADSYKLAMRLPRRMVLADGSDVLACSYHTDDRMPCPLALVDIDNGQVRWKEVPWLGAIYPVSRKNLVVGIRQPFEDIVPKDRGYLIDLASGKVVLGSLPPAWPLWSDETHLVLSGGNGDVTIADIASGKTTVLHAEAHGLGKMRVNGMFFGGALLISGPRREGATAKEAQSRPATWMMQAWGTNPLKKRDECDAFAEKGSPNSILEHKGELWKRWCPTPLGTKHFCFARESGLWEVREIDSLEKLFSIGVERDGRPSPLGVRTQVVGGIRYVDQSGRILCYERKQGGEKVRIFTCDVRTGKEAASVSVLAEELANIFVRWIDKRWVVLAFMQDKDGLSVIPFGLDDLRELAPRFRLPWASPYNRAVSGSLIVMATEKDVIIVDVSGMFKSDASLVSSGRAND